MRMAVFSNAWSVRHGGGVAYIAAWAQALGALGPVDLYFTTPVQPQEIEELYGLDLSGVCIRQVPGDQATGGPGGRWLAGLRRMVAERGYDLLVRQSPMIPRPTACRRGILLTEFPFQKQVSWRERLYLGTYAAVVANSHFTARWIGRRWGRQAWVIHPPVRPIESLAKRPAIVAVGRFTGGKRNKHQLEMVTAFRRLREYGYPEWELHLCGIAEDTRYIEEVRQAAEGLPVHVHVDLIRAELERVIGQASIFWHATGVECMEEEEPDRMEHFGMSTAEAMSAGCVPIVIGRGGQPEVVGQELSGWTWQDWGECVEKTRQVMVEPGLCQALAESARQQAATFSFPCFREQVHELVRGERGDRVTG